MNSSNESALATVAAVFVLFTTMLDPRVSSIMAVILLFAFAIYKILETRKQQPQS